MVGTQPLSKVVLDPRLESADSDRSDNVWPREASETRVRLRETTPDGGAQNPMQAAKEEVDRLRQRVSSTVAEGG